MDDNNIVTPEGFESFLSGLATDSGSTSGEEGATQAQPADAGTQNDSGAVAAPATEEGNGTSETAPAVANAGSVVENNTAPTQTGNNNANAAFAHMRTQNKSYEQALGHMLQSMGLDANLAKDPERVTQAFQKAAVAKQAEQMKVPAELLDRIATLENMNTQREQQRIAGLAMQGFQQVKDKYKLTDSEISAFARQLQEAGTNPFEKEMDLDLQYRVHNIDTIINKRVDAAVQEALTKQGNAAVHASSPANTVNRPDSSTGKDQIDTMAQFNAYLSKL